MCYSLDPSWGDIFLLGTYFGYRITESFRLKKTCPQAGLKDTHLSVDNRISVRNWRSEKLIKSFRNPQYLFELLDCVQFPW